MEEKRATVVSTLSQKMKEPVATNYERAIYKMCQRLSDDDNPIEDVYAKHAFDKVGELMLCETRQDRERVLADIKADAVGNKSSSFDDVRNEDEMEARILVQGVKVKKGEIPCKNPKCRSMECYYFSKQTRGADEPETIFYLCSKCDTRWRM